MRHLHGAEASCCFVQIYSSLCEFFRKSSILQLFFRDIIFEIGDFFLVSGFDILDFLFKLFPSITFLTIVRSY